uniref:Uncharacterized protein n=1 Tax=Hucho hucho TaxID=62062 RepID=A0A4W5KRI4_9TELE
MLLNDLLFISCNLIGLRDRQCTTFSSVKIKNRIGVMRHVVKNGLLWDDLYIGFQNRLSREPDVYHHRFWNHFQTELPVAGPDWDLFLQQVSSYQRSAEPQGIQTESASASTLF